MNKWNIYRNKKGTKRKPSQGLTFIIIPETADKPYRFNLSLSFLKTLAVSIGFLLIITIGLCIAFYGTRLEIGALNELKKDNGRKSETINLLKEEIKEMEAQKESITKKQSEIKKLMGIKEDARYEIKSSDGGMGGDDKNGYIPEYADVLGQVQEVKTYLDRQEQELDELIAQVDNRTDYFRALPNQWPVNGNVTSTYGWRDSPFGGKTRSFHNGIDIASDVGADVVAAADGRVVFSGYQPVYGRTIIIEHAYNFKTKYGHNSALLVELGDTVKKGDVIAKVGSTGRSTGPHLHFTVYKSGNTQDPLIYLP